MAGPVRFGVAPIAWSNSDLPQLGGETTLETCLKAAEKMQKAETCKVMVGGASDKKP